MNGSEKKKDVDGVISPLVMAGIDALGPLVIPPVTQDRGETAALPEKKRTRARKAVVPVAQATKGGAGKSQAILTKEKETNEHQTELPEPMAIVDNTGQDAFVQCTVRLAVSNSSVNSVVVHMQKSRF